MTTSTFPSRLSFAALRPLAAWAALLWTLPATAASVALAWDPCTGPEVTGYLAYCGVSQSGQFQSVDVGTNTTFTFSNLVTGVSYSFHVTAYTHSRVESEPSNPLEYTPLPPIVVPDSGSNAPIVNIPPQAGELSLQTMSDLPRTMPAATLLSHAADADNDPLVLSAVSGTSANGGTVAIVEDAVIYTPATGYVGNDQFSYTVSDGQGGTATGTVSVRVWDKLDPTINRISRLSASPAGLTVYFTGLADLVYTIERTTDLATSVWTPIGMVTAPQAGLAEFTDPAPASGAAFYRTVTQ